MGCSIFYAVPFLLRSNSVRCVCVAIIFCRLFPKDIFNFYYSPVAECNHVEISLHSQVYFYTKKYLYGGFFHKHFYTQWSLFLKEYSYSQGRDVERGLVFKGGLFNIKLLIILHSFLEWLPWLFHSYKVWRRVIGRTSN